MIRTVFRASVLLALALLPATPSAAVTMDQLWPNTDGLLWPYAQHYESLVENPQTVDGQVRLVLDGLAIAAPSIVTQYLHHEAVLSPPSPLLAQTRLADPFLQHVWLARPDLRSKIPQSLAGGSCPTNAPPGPYAVLLNGEFAFLKAPTEIAAWRCNLANTRSWQWLASDLTVGMHLFMLQLIPDLAPDVYLHAEVGAIEAVTVPAGTFNNCVRVDYVVDYGLSVCTDGNGTEIGSYRSETHGYIHYAPDVGPVDSFEEFFLYQQMTGACADPSLIGVPYDRATMKLTSVPTAVRPGTWGAVKLLYR